MGYDTEVQFTVNQESYVFEKLEAVVRNSPETSRSESVQFTEVESDAKKGIYKINVKILEQVSDIMIRPVCTLLPKISSISPALEANGCNQDSAITIAFNKEMNPESFKNSNGTIAGLSITNGDDEDLSAYFNEPYFASDNKTLVILPLCYADNPKFLLPPDESKSSLNIKVNYTFVDVKDEDGLSFTENGTHNYKINKNFNEQKEVTVLVQNPVSSYGSFLSAGEKSCIVGFGFEVEFTLNTESYIFEGFEAVSKNDTSLSRADCVQFTLNSSDADVKKGIYKIKIRVLNETDDILIRPVCTLLPKISSISPTLEANGCNQDSAITITFNKNMNPESFKNSNGKITGLSITNGDDEDLSAYFDEPYFDSDNKTLVIRPLCYADNPKFLLSPDESKSSLNIKVNYTFVDVKDEDGLSFTENGTHNYKINKNFDKQEEVTVLVQNPVSSYGSFLSAGEKSCIVGFGFEIEFTLNKEAYIFQGFEAVSQNNVLDESFVSFENRQYDDETGIYRAKVRVLKAASDILIRPKCTLIENAEVTITKSEKGTDNISPADGTKVQSFIKREYTISFSPDDDYEFIRWELYDINTGEEIPNETYVTIAEPYESETSYKVTQVPDTGIELALRPIVTRRPQILSGTPANSNAGSLKDSTIQVIFNHDMSPNSIYYTKSEINSLKNNGIDYSQFLPALAEDELTGNLQNHYGYKADDGEVHFKNIVIKDNRTNGNLLEYFNAPSFETSKILSIPVKNGKDFPSYTQIYVCIEKEFFFEEDSVQVTLSSYKDWVYWVTDETDTSAPVLIKYNGSDFSVSKDNSSSAWESTASASFTLSDIPNFNFITNNKIYLKMALQDTGCGPSPKFKMILTKKGNSSYKVSDNFSYSYTLPYTDVSGTIAYYDGEIDLDSFDGGDDKSFEEGVYGATFEFTDQSGNKIENPSDSKAFYFAYDKTAPKNLDFAVTNGTSEDEYKLSWTNATDSDFSKSVVTIKPSDGEDTYYATTGTSQTINLEAGNNLEAGKSYKITVTSYDYAGNNSTYTYNRFLTGLSVSGTPASALYYVGDRLDTSGLTVTATYSDRTTKTVTCFTVAAFSEVNLGTEPEDTISYTEDGVTKTAKPSGTFYVASSGAKPTEKPVKLTDYSGTLSGGTYYKFGDFPQTIAKGTVTFSDAPVYKGWYLGSDGYFYEKCTENANHNNYTYSDNTTVAQASANSEKYFKVEPIVWRALTTTFDHDANGTGDKILLLSESELTDVLYYGSTSSRTLNGVSIYANNYKYSNIRAYLNGTANQFVTDGGTSNSYTIDWSDKGFLQSAFTRTAQDLIAKTIVDNSAASMKDADNNLEVSTSYACDNTKDKIFLLSEKEATTVAYGFTTYDAHGTGNSRIRVTTDYAKANHAYQDTTTAGYGGYWVLRSPYYDGTRRSACLVLYDGYAKTGSSVAYESWGVVPALCISAQ